METISKNALPPFPQTAIAKLRGLVQMFPPPDDITPAQLGRLILTIHPALAHSPLQAWTILSRHTEELGLPQLDKPSISSSTDSLGLLGYHVQTIERVDDKTARVTFSPPLGGRKPVVVNVPAGPRQLRPLPFNGNLEFNPTPRFMGLLTCFLQAHALGWDISLIPPPLPSTASSSTSTLVKVFGQLLGYDAETLHIYKELGGRELIMRRKIKEGGATTWEPRCVMYLTVNAQSHIFFCNPVRSLKAFGQDDWCTFLVST